jgi:hypothetical protein
MFRKLIVFVFAGVLLLNICGCFLIIAGTAGGSGTAIWLSGKLTQDVNASYERTVTAAANALKSLRLPINKESRESEVTQFRSKYTDGKEIWIDVRKVTETASKVEVRVGAIQPNKEAAEKILNKIQAYL